MYYSSFLFLIQEYHLENTNDILSCVNISGPFLDYEKQLNLYKYLGMASSVLWASFWLIWVTAYLAQASFHSLT